jgi:hypothetical protein
MNVEDSNISLGRKLFRLGSQKILVDERFDFS